MDFYDLIRSRPRHIHYAVAVNGRALKCLVELGKNSCIARPMKWANSNDWLTFMPRLGYMQVIHSLMDGDGDITVELEDSSGRTC